MPNKDNRIGEQLLALEPISSSTKQQIEKEIHAMFVQELSTGRRSTFGIIAIVALISAGVCGSLALTEPELPKLVRVGLAVGTLFGLSWAAVAARICWRGVLDGKLDAQRIATMVWVFTVLMMVFFLMAGMSAKDRMLGLMMIANGIAFLIGAAVYWLNYRIERAELNTRETLLRIELWLAELSEKGT